MNSTAPRKKSHPPYRPQVLVVLVFAMALGVIPGMYRRWAMRREYDRRYSKLLNLPSSISFPRAYLQRMPGVVGKALWIDFYQPDPGEDENLRAWFVKHEGFPEFKLSAPVLPKPLGDWRTERGRQFLVISRISDNGWVHITLGQGMSPDEAQKDLDNYPWRSEMQAMQSHRNE